MQSGVDFSGTNVQESRCRRARPRQDRRPHSLRGLRRTRECRRPARAASAVRGTLPLEKGLAHELLLHGNRLLVLSQTISGPIPVDGGDRSGRPGRTRRRRRSWRSTSPIRRGCVVRTLELDGGYLTARLVGRAARIVLSSPLARELPFVQPDGSDPGAVARATERNRDITGRRESVAGCPATCSAARVAA